MKTTKRRRESKGTRARIQNAIIIGAFTGLGLVLLGADRFKSLMGKIHPPSVFEEWK